MSYKNAINILPENLLSDIQKYFNGGIIYIPKASEKAGWGELSGSRKDIDNRNINIRELFNSGIKITKLAKEYFLSEETIKKIVYSKKVIS